MREVDKKVVRCIPAYDTARILHKLQGLFPDLPQDLIAVAFPVAVVDRMKMIDVQHDRIGGKIPVIDVKLCSIAEKELLVVKPCQLVALRPAQRVPILEKLDGPQDTGQNDLRARIWLGNEVGRAKRQACHLRFAVCRHYDHWNTGVSGVRPDLAQDLESVDIRQLQVQKNQAEALELSADDLQRLGSCSDRNDIVCIPEVQIHQLLIDDLILDQKDPSSVCSRPKSRCFLRHEYCPPTLFHSAAAEMSRDIQCYYNLALLLCQFPAGHVFPIPFFTFVKHIIALRILQPNGNLL